MHKRSIIIIFFNVQFLFTYNDYVEIMVESKYLCIFDYDRV